MLRDRESVRAFYNNVYSVYLPVYSLCLSHTGGWVGELKEFWGEDVAQGQACIASISMRLWSKELGTRVKDSAKNDASKRVGRGGGEERKEKLADKPWNFETAHFSCLSAHTGI